MKLLALSPARMATAVIITRDRVRRPGARTAPMMRLLPRRDWRGGVPPGGPRRDEQDRRCVAFRNSAEEQMRRCPVLMVVASVAAVWGAGALTAAGAAGAAV